jgi:TrmH family RNA methyltransferase
MLTSIKNPLVKHIRKLHRSKERKEQNMLLLEGTNLIRVACEVDYELMTVCCTPEWQKNHPQLWQEIAKVAKRLELVSSEVLSAIATTVNPDGIIATAPRRNSNIVLTKEFKLGLVLERLQDPGNLGTIIRSAVATDVDGLWLSTDSVDVDNPKVLRASVGEWFKVAIAVHSNLPELVQSYQQQGIQIVATSSQAQKTYWEVDWQSPSLILLGNEGAGLSEELMAIADCQVKIPLSREVESLNVAIAAALLLYEAKRQRQLKRE